MDIPTAVVLDIPDMEKEDSQQAADNILQEAAVLHTAVVVGHNVLGAQLPAGAENMLEAGAERIQVAGAPARTLGLVGQEVPAANCSANSGLWSKESRRGSFVQTMGIKYIPTNFEKMK